MGSLYPTAAEDTGVTISIKVPGRPKAGTDDFSGMCHGYGGCATMSPKKSDLDKAGREFDMDKATGCKRTPGTAGAHPIMKPHYAQQLARTQGEIRADCPPGSTTCSREKIGPTFQVTD